MKHILTYSLLLLLLFCGSIRYGFARDVAPSLDSKTLTFRDLTLSDGLSDLLVNAIYKDSLGYVWIGTGSSIDRFDGTHVRRFPFHHADEKLKRVLSIAETERGIIWVGNGMGLWRLQASRLGFEQVVPDRIHTAVNALWYDGHGSLYIATNQGLFIHTDGIFEQHLIDNNSLAPANQVKGIAPGANGSLWLTTGDGLYRYHPATKSKQRYLPSGVDDTFVATLRTIVKVEETLYIATLGHGLWMFHIPSATFSRYLDVGSKQISSLSTDGREMLYVGTDGNGIHFIDLPQRRVVRHLSYQPERRELRSNSVYSLLVDREGLIWVGYYQEGLDYTLYQDNLFTTYAYPPHFTSRDLPVRALSIHGEEKLIGSRNGLYYIDESRQLYREYTAPQLRSSMVFAIVRYHDLYYIGTYGGGLYTFNPRTLQLSDFDSRQVTPFVNGHIFCFEVDAHDRLWIGTSNGLYCYQGRQELFHFTDSNSKLPEGNVYELFFDSTDRGWICTENGMALFDPSTQKIRTDAFPEGFIHQQKIREVYESSDHRLYFFPDKGPVCISNLTMTEFHRETPGASTGVCDGMFFIEDDARRLWVGTNNGLFCYDGTSVVPYTYSDGLPSPVFTLCPPVLDEAGNLWMGNSKGLILLKKGDLEHQHRLSYPLRVTDVLVSGHSSPLSASAKRASAPQLKLMPSQNNLSFCFSDFSYTSPTFTSYEYLLEGYDTEWTAVVGVAEAVYYGLPTGHYTFKVRKTGHPDTETQLQLYIAASLWRWLWLMPAALLLWGLYVWLKRKQRLSRLATPLAPQVVEVMDEASDAEAGEQEEDTPSAAAPAPEKYRTLHLSEADCRQLVERLDALMQEEKIYLDSNMKIADLARRMDISAHTLSYLFNQYLECNYYDYINDYRIAEFKQLVQSEQQSLYTLSALAERCGFSSRASFFRYFKKATGITPSEYIHQQEEQQEKNAQK